MDLTYLKKLSDNMHTAHGIMIPVWQDFCMEVWPEMADFYETKNMGKDLAAHLMSGIPSLARRQLGDAFEALTRTGDWFSMKTQDPELNLENDARDWMEKATKKMRLAMDTQYTGFSRACKQVDHGYVALGQWPMTIEVNPKYNGMLYRAWHLKDVAFEEDISGQVCTISHKLKLGAREAVTMFQGNCSDTIQQLSKDKPFDKVDLIRMVMPTEMTDERLRQPYVSVYFDPAALSKPLEVVGQWDNVYLIPRWQTRGSISQYAHSPASMIAQPDARTFQQMTLSMLDAAEMGARPPMAARSNLFREDAEMSAGSITWADMEGDEDIRKSFQVISNDKSGYQFSLELWNHVRDQIGKAWYNNMLQSPDTSRARTAYEASIIVQDHIRGLLPIFQPIKGEYQAPLCERTFNRLFRGGYFNSLGPIPDSLRGENAIEFEFMSPISQAEDQAKVAQFQQMMSLLSEASGVDPNARFTFKMDVALRDAAEGGNIQAKWLNTEQEAKDLADAAQEAAAQQQMLDQVQQGSEIAKNLTGNDGASSLAEQNRQPAPAFGG